MLPPKDVCPGTISHLALWLGLSETDDKYNMCHLSRAQHFTCTSNSFNKLVFVDNPKWVNKETEKA